MSTIFKHQPKPAPASAPPIEVEVEVIEKITRRHYGMEQVQVAGDGPYPSLEWRQLPGSASGPAFFYGGRVYAPGDRVRVNVAFAAMALESGICRVADGSFYTAEALIAHGRKARGEV